MKDEFIRFAVFWGVWILVPILVDGMTTISGLVGHLIFSLKN